MYKKVEHASGRAAAQQNAGSGRLLPGGQPRGLGDLKVDKAPPDGARVVRRQQSVGRGVGDQYLFHRRHLERREAHVDVEILVWVEEGDHLLARHEEQVGLVEDDAIVEVGVKPLLEHLQRAHGGARLHEERVLELGQREFSLAQPCAAVEPEGVPVGDREGLEGVQIVGVLESLRR